MSARNSRKQEEEARKAAEKEYAKIEKRHARALKEARSTYTA